MENRERISTRIKLSALWITVMFFYAYADIKCFFETGMIEKVMSGNIDGLIISQSFLFYGAILMTIPIVMIFLSLVLPQKVNRILNIVIPALHIPLALLVLTVGTETWYYYYFYTFFEIVTHITIIVYSVKWKDE